MSKDIREEATLYYNNFLLYKKRTKKVFKSIVVYINTNKIVLEDVSKDNIKLLITKWNNTDNYSCQDYLDMRVISNNIIINDEDLSLKELVKNYLFFFDKFHKDLYKFYEYASKIEGKKD